MPLLNLEEFLCVTKGPASSSEFSVSGLLIGSESSSYNRNKPNELGWVLIFGHEGNKGKCGAGGVNALGGQDKCESPTLPRFPWASMGANGLGGSGTMSQ